jgi:hypothetical protein
MFHRVIAVIVLFSFLFMEIGCYAVQSETAQVAAPDVEIVSIVLKDGRTITFDEVGHIEKDEVIGGIRDEVGSLHYAHYPLAQIVSMKTRRIDPGNTSVTIAAVLVGALILTAYLVASSFANGLRGKK